MQAHAHPQSCALGPRVHSQGTRGLGGGHHGLERGGVGHEEGIALGIHLHSTVGGEGSP